MKLIRPKSIKESTMPAFLSRKNLIVVFGSFLVLLSFVIFLYPQLKENQELDARVKEFLDSHYWGRGDMNVP